MTLLKSKLNKLLENITKDLDISPTKYKQAVDRYSAVARWLSNGSFEGELHVYPQGSFRIGTVVRPIIEGRESRYDIDLVCKFSNVKNTITPEFLKRLVGDRLSENATYKNMLDDEGRRCWTLLYAEQDGIGFHLDILPAINEEQQYIQELLLEGVTPSIAINAIAVTNKDELNNYHWTRSNPIGYAQWFESINKYSFDLIKGIQKQILFEQNTSVFNKVDEVPDELVKTPLQRAIQVLKRHRDIRFAGLENESDKPISSIITTLSAHLYDKESDVYSAIENIVKKLISTETLLYSTTSEVNTLQNYIKKDSSGDWIILNPANPSENFADRWKENNNRKAKAFFQWLKWVETDIIDLLNLKNFEQIEKSLESSLGKEVVKRSSSSMNSLGSINSFPQVKIQTPNKPWKNK